jgi:antitoxin component YwqK of YwqJK toxin-antitoxin module
VAVRTELEILFPASQKKSAPVTAITRDDLDDVYHTQVTSTLQELGVKLTDKQKLDFAVSFQSQISESNIEVNALHLEEEISFLKNEIQNFIYHMNNEEGSLQSGVQLYRSTSELRITLIDMDGNVLAESHLEENDIATMDNHGTRPEILAAKTKEYGVATRYSETLHNKFLYVAYGYDEDNDNRRIYVRFSKAMNDIQEQRVMRVYEDELLKALSASDVDMDASQRISFLNSFVEKLKSKLAEKNINSDLEQNEKVVKAYTIKLEEKSQEIADALKLELGTFIDYIRNAGSDLQASSEIYAQSADIRITLIDQDGVVLADSELERDRVAQLENHGSRPEVAQSNTIPYGVISRFSNTLQQKFVYISHRLAEPVKGIQYVRLARSLRSDYSRIRMDGDEIMDMYVSLIEKSLGRSGVNLSANQDRNFKDHFKSMSSKRNHEIKMDHKLEQYRLYIEEINQAFDAIRLEINEDQDNTFFEIYKENVIREFSASSDIDAVANEEAVRTYYKNMVSKNQQQKKMVKREGLAIIYYDNGRIKEKGQYKAGKKDGDWKDYNQKGKLLTIVTYDQGKAIKTENPGAIQDSVVYHENGRIKMQGITNARKRQGEWKHYDAKGKLLTITIYDFGDIMSQENPGAIGNITEYHENGRVKAEGMTNNNKRDGVWKFYDSRGVHTKTVTYSNGETLKTISMIEESGPKLREGAAVTYHDNGRIRETGKYSKGRKNGEWKEFNTRGKLLKIKIYDHGKVLSEQSPHKIKPFLSYHDNGRIKEKGVMKSGQREGEWLLYSKRGKLIRTTHYLDGEIIDKSNSGLIGPITNYYDNGTIKEEGIMNDGQRDGVWKIYDDDGHHVENITYRKGKVLKQDKV